MTKLATPAALVLTALAYFVPSVAGGAPVVYAACTTIAILAVMSYGADLILSYLGEVSLGHTIFWAAGGYAAAILAQRRAGIALGEEVGRQIAPKLSSLPECTESELVMGAELSA